MRREDALEEFDPYVMVMRAAGYLMKQGPATQQERWEETSGYSPSTLASNIAALICAASFARERGDEEATVFLEQYADFIEGNLELWMVTEDGALLPDVKRHYVRLNPVRLGDELPDAGVGDALIPIPNQRLGEPTEFPAKEVVDAGFLELVRYGIRRAGDPLVVDLLRVVDARLKIETPFGACWRRYSHDGYGQQADGEPYAGVGRGRAWPLLTGERGHYEVAAGGDARPYIRAMERFASPTGLLPEQVWDEPDKPEAHMFFGKPTKYFAPEQTARVFQSLISPRDFWLEVVPGFTDTPKFRTIPLSALIVEQQEGALLARTRDGSLQFDIMKVFEAYISYIVVDSFKVISPGRHNPRITIDRLVVSRQSWQLSPSEIEFADVADDSLRFCEARRWARSNGMPRFVFARITTEAKPFFVDFNSPIYIDIFSRVLRKSKESGGGNTVVSITEMLPSPDQAWLPDGEGDRYACELRFVALDLNSSDESNRSPASTPHTGRY